jgi:hypothetical protein
LQKAVKCGVYVYTPLLLHAYHALYSMGHSHHIQNGSHNCRGPAKAQGSKAKSTSRVSAAQSKHNERQSDTKGAHHLAHWGPHRGDPTSLCFVFESWLGGFLQASPCGLVSNRPGFPTGDYPGKSLESTWPRFDRGGGALGLVWSHREALALLALTHKW